MDRKNYGIRFRNTLYQRQYNGDADKLSRGIKISNSKNITKSEAIKKGFENKHVFEENNTKFWRFDSGKICKIPDIDSRKNICLQKHIELGHRGVEYTYYDLKQNLYWPGMKATIERITKECNVCQINNRKKNLPAKYINTSRPMEIIGVDLLEIRRLNKYVLIGIDYFTRFVCTSVVSNKNSEGIVCAMEEWFLNGIFPEKVITDNGLEFSNQNLYNLMQKYGINHEKIGVESHRSNGRVERVIGTFRDYIAKCEDENFEEFIKEFTDIYNNTFHISIKKTPTEAMNNPLNDELFEKNISAKWEKHGKKQNKEKFDIGEKVRIAQNENISKENKGRFQRLGKIIHVYDSGKLMIRMLDTNKITMKNYKLVKKIVVANRFERGDVEPLDV